MSKLSTYMALPTMRGSNANGEWVKFSDGTQICLHKIAVAVRNVPANDNFVVSGWTYPSAFIVAPNVSTTNNSAQPTAFLPAPEGVRNNQVDLVSIRNITTSALPNIQNNLMLTAIGRWY